MTTNTINTNMSNVISLVPKRPQEPTISLELTRDEVVTLLLMCETMMKEGVIEDNDRLHGKAMIAFMRFAEDDE